MRDLRCGSRELEPQPKKPLSQRRPFMPFLVELASGIQLTIDHPKALARRGPVAVYIDLAGNYTLFDSTGVSQLTDNTGNG